MKLKAFRFPKEVSDEMIRAILDGRKSIIRRVVKPPPQNNDCEHEMITYNDMLPQFCSGDYTCVCRKCGYGVVLLSGESIFRPPYRPGVRETWCWCHCWDCGMDSETGCCDETAKKFYNAEKAEWGCYGYKASFLPNETPFDCWHPSIYMPREAARIFLRVTEVRVERLQEISSAGISKEGIVTIGSPGSPERINPYFAFKELWDSTIKKSDLPLYGWAANPWVFVIEFERISREEALKNA